MEWTLEVRGSSANERIAKQFETLVTHFCLVYVRFNSCQLIFSLPEAFLQKIIEDLYFESLHKNMIVEERLKLFCVNRALSVCFHQKIIKICISEFRRKIEGAVL